MVAVINPIESQIEESLAQSIEGIKSSMEQLHLLARAGVSQAMVTLAKQGDPLGEAALLQALDEEDRNVNYSLKWALTEVGVSMIPHLCGKLQSSEPLGGSYEIIRALEWIAGSKRADQLPTLCELINHTETTVRYWAVHTLGEWKATHAISSLKQQLGRESQQPCREKIARVIDKLESLVG
jgi:HEAT repeats